MAALDEMIGQKKAEIKRLQIELATLEEARNRTLGLPKAPAPKQRAARSDVKGHVLNLLEEVGRSGLVAASAVEMAAKRDIHLERGTVSSLLSRLKHDKIVRYDGTVYRLAKFGNESGPSAGEQQAASVHPFPASKSMP